MPSFSLRSKQALDTCDARLVDLFELVIQKRDCTVLEGHRGEEAQNEAFRTGHSNIKWPAGNHNKKPSLAVDVMPYPIDWEDTEGHKLFAEFVQGVALGYGVEVTWGGSWKRLVDAPHWEVKRNAG